MPSEQHEEVLVDRRASVFGGGGEFPDVGSFSGGAPVFNLLKKSEKLHVKFLMLPMAVVLGLATFDLGWLVL